MVSSPLSMPSSDSAPISSLPSGPLLPPETQNLQTCLRLLWLPSWVRWWNLTKTSVYCWLVTIKSRRRTVKLPLSKLSKSDHERVDMEASPPALLDSNTTDKAVPRTGDAFCNRSLKISRSKSKPPRQFMKVWRVFFSGCCQKRCTMTIKQHRAIQVTR